MLVVSDLISKSTIPTIRPQQFLESPAKDFILNLECDYRYMKMGYYVSMYAETAENPVIPTCGNILDAYRAPILLLRAKKRGIPTPPHVVTNSAKEIIYELDFPIAVFPTNPFSSDGYKIVRSQSSLYKALKSLGMNYNYPVCAEALLGEIQSIKCIFGAVDYQNAASVGQMFYEEFAIPLTRLYVQDAGGKCFLCSASPLNRSELCLKDFQLIEEKLKELATTLD